MVNEAKNGPENLPRAGSLATRRLSGGRSLELNSIKSIK